MFDFIKTKTLDLDKKTKKKTGLPHKGEDVPLGEDSGNESENFEPVLSYQVVTRHRSKQLYDRLWSHIIVKETIQFRAYTALKRLISFSS